MSTPCWLTRVFTFFKFFNFPFSGELARLTLTSFYGGDVGPAWDGYTGATALDSIRNGLEQRYTMGELLARGEVVGALGARGFEWINFAALVGGLFLMARGIVRWHIPAAVLAGLLLPALVAHALDPGAYLGPLTHAFAGATMLGAFFVATIPSRPRPAIAVDSPAGGTNVVCATVPGEAEQVHHQVDVVFVGIVVPVDEVDDRGVPGHGWASSGDPGRVGPLRSAGSSPAVPWRRR